MISLKYKGLSFNFVQTLLEQSVDEELISTLNSDFVEEYKSTIRAGLSPVDGFGRFPAYADVKKYPGKKKANRAVNLELTGEMLEAITASQLSNTKAQIGIGAGASEFIKTKAQANNLGVPEKNIATRRFIPQMGENLIVTLQRKLRDIYAKHLLKIIKQRN